MRSNTTTRTRLLSTTVLAGVGLMLSAAPALAQSSETMETVTVTGYRASLTESTNAKRASVNFSDTVFAQDIGKFPDTNIAEAFNRIPGITIQRENDGTGMRIQVRGLGTDFVKITLNGAVVQTASTGPTGAGGSNREVDLNIFPIELFTQLSVNKTSTADMIEGGASGVIEMRSARPFDNPGTHFSYNLQGTDFAKNGNIGERGTLIGSWTNDKFGVLVGISGQNNRIMVTGYEGASNSVTTPNLTAAQYYGTGTTNTCTSTGSYNMNTCNTVGGNTDWAVPYTTAHNAVSNGVATGPAVDAATIAAMSAASKSTVTNNTTIDKAMLMAMNPGLTIDQISNATVPRTGRPMYESGTRKRYNGILSLEYRPSDSLHFYWDNILGVIENNLDREDLFWVARNGYSIPMNMQVDKNNVVTYGQFGNANMSLEARPYKEKSDYFSLNPGMDWQVNDLLHVDAQVNYSRAHFFRDSPTYLFSTLPGVLTFSNTGSLPTFSMAGMQDPTNYGWYTGSDVRIQQERRYEYTKGAHANASYGGDLFKVQVGAAWDEAYRLIRGYNNTAAFENYVCGAGLSTFLPTPNTNNGCGNYTAPAYPGYGTGYTTGFAAETAAGPALANASIAQYLSPGPNGFAKVNYAGLNAITNYNYFATHPSLGAATNLQDPGRTNFSTGTNTNISSGIIDEKTMGFYAEFSGTLKRGDQKIKYNFGGRWIRTLQALTGYTSITDPRNAAQNLADGGKYPNYIVPATMKGSYSAFLPSANLVWEMFDDFQVRAAVSRTLTRANPASMLPQLSGGGSDAQTWNLGNPQLRPYYSTNIDFGAELYTGGEGYVGIGLFRKMITGFQNNYSSTQPFSYLSQFGITYDTLGATQQAAINSAGGPNVATVTIVQARNATGLETISGTELNWVQPLDFWLETYGLKGFGFTANATFVKTKSSGAAPAVVLGVSPTQYNTTMYYDNNGITAKLSYSYQRGTITNSNVYGVISNRTDITAEYSKDYGTVDLSTGIKLQKLFGEIPTDPELTFDIQNLTHAKVGCSYKQWPNLVNDCYVPGSLFMLGIRGNY